MQANFLKNIKFSIYGESHSTSIGVIFDSIPSGIEIDITEIQEKLKKRNPGKKYNTKRIEKDEIIIESGLIKNISTGTPLMIKLKNLDTNSLAYNKKEFRMTHSDFVSYLKFGESYPYSGGGPFSGRLTAVIVVIGNICKQILQNQGEKPQIYGQIKQIQNIESKSFSLATKEELEELEFKKFPSITKDQEFLEKLNNSEDSYGAKLEFMYSNPIPNLGEIYFDGFDAILAHAVFSIPGIRSFSLINSEEHFKKKGSEMLEDFKIENNKIVMTTNNSSGINGGITSGLNPILFECIVKAPTPKNNIQKILIKNYKNFEIEEKKFGGRHDSIIANKVIEVVKAWMYIIILDLKEVK